MGNDEAFSGDGRQWSLSFVVVDNKLGKIPLTRDPKDDVNPLPKTEAMSKATSRATIRLVVANAVASFEWYLSRDADVVATDVVASLEQSIHQTTNSAS